MLTGKTIVLGVTGGIAVYKAADLVSRLRKLGADVRVILTANAQKFMPSLTFETLSGNPVAASMFDRPQQHEIRHISWAKAASLFIVAPATANLMGKYANGIADDMLTSTLLATRAPVLLAPAMNANMWRHPATQANLLTLRARGVEMVGPNRGRLACGDDDEGRMAEPSEIVEAICGKLTAKADFAGRRVLVTAGPTREALDPVRFLTNRSSGKMSYALAEAARDRGAQVTLVTGPVALPAPHGMEIVRVESTEDLLAAMMELSGAQDVIIQAAAPADYTMEKAAQKLKKDGDAPLVLTLSQTPDVAKAVGEGRRQDQIIVIFAAETEHGVEHAREKLHRKNADLVVLNDVTRAGCGFDADTNAVTLVTRDAAEELPLANKREIAEGILDRVIAIRI